MALLFDRDEKTVRKHVNNVFKENELDKKTTRKKCVLMDVSGLQHPFFGISREKLRIIPE